MNLAVFWQVGHFDFLNFDDDVYVSNNPHIREGLTWKGICWAFTAEFFGHKTPNADYWQPVTFLSRMVDMEIFGLNPSGHHLSNLFFHILNSVLLFLILSRMTSTPWPSAFVAVLFAVHPLRVEAVAWITARKDVLSAFFWFLTIGAYVRYVRQPGFVRYFWVVFIFLSGLMAKPMVMTLPLILLLMDFWPLNRIHRNPWPRLLLEKIPLLVFSAAAAILARYGQPQALRYSPGIQIESAIGGYVWYIWKLFYPVHLAIFHPIKIYSPVFIAVSGLSLLGITLWTLSEFRRAPYLAVGWLWFLITLLPVAGLVEPPYADRFSYIPHIGLLIMAGWGIADVAGKRIPGAASHNPLTGIFIGTCMIVSWFQLGHWKNSARVFEHAIEETKGNWKAQYNLGLALSTEGRPDEAILHYSEALKIRPDYADAHNNLGNILARQGRFAEALAHYQEALKFDPSHETVHNNIGNIFWQQGKLDEAVSHYTEAIRINPDSAAAHNNLGLVLAERGDLEKAIEHFSEALRIDPHLTDARANLEKAKGLLAAKKDFKPERP